MILATERDRIAHLLRRFGLGASEAEMDFYGQGSYEQAVDLLLGYQDRPEPNVPTAAQLRGQDNIFLPRQVGVAWCARMLATQRPLEEKLTLFWHDLLAVSGAKVDSGPVMAEYLHLLRANSAGSFRDLLFRVSKHPAMLYFLDNQLNVKGRPNENFAREVMELFSLGIGHYSERDVQEAARAFTGWTMEMRPGSRQRPEPGVLPRRGADFWFDEAQHDDGEKTVLGKTGPLNGDDVLNLLVDHPQCARHIARKMWEFFAFTKPPQGAIDRASAIFRNSGMQILALVRAIALAPEFVSDESARRLVKHPVDFVIASARAIGLGGSLKDWQLGGDPSQNQRALGPSIAANTAMRTMGQELIYPPDVSGWPEGEAWISTQTMVERMRWADRLWGRQLPGGDRRARTGTPSLRHDPWSMISGDPSPEGAVDKLLSLLDAQIEPVQRVALVEAASRQSAGEVTPANAMDVVHTVGRMLFGSPQFQFA